MRVVALLSVVLSGCGGWAAAILADAPSPEYHPVRPPDGVRAVVEIERAGARVRSWVFDPPDGAPKATVLCLHGLGDSKGSHVSTARRLARRGFRVVLVDSRGHGESSGKWLTYGVREAEDLHALADELERRRLLAPPLGVIGTSYGGATAIQLAAIDRRVRTVVAVAPFASLREVAADHERHMFGALAALVPDAWARDAVDRAGRLARFDPDRACARCVVGRARASLLLIHGREDTLVPWAHSARIRRAAKTEVELVVIEGAGHRHIGRAPGVARRIDAWLDRHLTPAR